MKEKLYSYLGFAKRSGNLITGFSTCVFGMKKRKVRLLLIAEDLAENTVKKITGEAEKHRIPYRMYGKIDEISQLLGCTGRGVFGITDSNFANIIVKEIDDTQSQKKEGFE